MASTAAEMYEACTVEAAKAVQETLKTRGEEENHQEEDPQSGRGPEPEPQPEPELELTGAGVQPKMEGLSEGVPPTSASGVHGWSEEQVANWVRDVLKFEDVAQVVTEQGVDGATATEMIRDDWVELRVSGFKAAKVVAQVNKLV